VFLKLPLAVLRNGLLHISFGLHFGLKYFSVLALLLFGYAHLCLELFIDTKVSLLSWLHSAGGNPFGVATGVMVSASTSTPQ
jgi:hypothetical protein